MKLDILVVAAHPDDAEISVGGTLLLAKQAGRSCGVIDVTRGEMGTRGTAQDRDAETEQATRLLGLDERRNLGQPDGRVEVTLEAREALAGHMRELAPDLVISHHVEDLHPDHAATGRLAHDAWYLSGLRRLAEQGGGAPARRPKRLLHFLSHVPFEPTLVVDIGPVWERKLEVVRAYASQLAPDGETDRGQHFLFGADILGRMETKARHYGESIGVRYGEPLFSRGPLACGDPAGWLLGS